MEEIVQTIFLKADIKEEGLIKYWGLYLIRESQCFKQL